jgi:hypothetical protein
MMRNFPRQEIRNHDSPKITHHGYRCTKKIYPVWGIFYFYFIPRLGYILFLFYTPFGVYFFSIVKNIPQTGYIFFSIHKNIPQTGYIFFSI